MTTLPFTFCHAVCTQNGNTFVNKAWNFIKYKIKNLEIFYKPLNNGKVWIKHNFCKRTERWTAFPHETTNRPPHLSMRVGQKWSKESPRLKYIFWNACFKGRISVSQCSNLALQYLSIEKIAKYMGKIQRSDARLHTFYNKN